MKVITPQVAPTLASALVEGQAATVDTFDQLRVVRYAPVEVAADRCDRRGLPAQLSAPLRANEVFEGNAQHVVSCCQPAFRALQDLAERPQRVTSSSPAADKPRHLLFTRQAGEVGMHEVIRTSINPVSKGNEDVARVAPDDDHVHRLRAQER